jgi:ribosomal protein L40E
VIFTTGVPDMKCPKCGSENREEAKFCGKCRSKLSRVFPQCNAENPPDNTFCDQCGTDFLAPKEPTQIDYAQPQSYTPKHLADKILTNRKTLEGERKLVTVRFADVANFTSLSEKLEPEVGFSTVLRGYQSLNRASGQSIDIR